MIGIDWGTSQFRAFRFAPNGEILARHSSGHGILDVADGDFAGTLRAELAPWLADGETKIIMSGMIGSRQGWVEAPYLPCPAGLANIAAGLIGVPFDGAEILLVPGLSDRDDSGIPEVMRGEETQVLGALASIGAAGIVCLPGSHSKWVEVADHRIASYRTYLTGETFAALRAGTILGRMMRDGATDLSTFDRGVARSGEPGHLLHQLFGVRTLGLTGRLADTASAAYLSGLLIGHEVRAAAPGDEIIHLVGAEPLCELYARAIGGCGGVALMGPADAAALGLTRLAVQRKFL